MIGKVALLGFVLAIVAALVVVGSTSLARAAEWNASGPGSYGYGTGRYSWMGEEMVGDGTQGGFGGWGPRSGEGCGLRER